ncbi:hypothetical protein GCM10012288_21590 [Malaciobacter pacificus]|uniref:PAS sensor-containing response regulator n=1 Tax=Malaciobacter pacificus TaxID=1080223 RepID=A0A5C2H7B2_9BACT|nr:response regulator [Malaciobacter pacificus]QEP34118.1 PAS sensor-containing response regulator [Malaciobacter pacificus]GGD47031.1 hypothetical protein GCM10012288_21590 [Malaciobacter pacificus]
MDKDFLKQLNILYVEDDELIKKELNDTLKLFFKDILLASDGEEAIELFNANQKNIDLILSDINMPKKDGIALLHEIRKIDKIVPFIFTTAFTNHEYLIDSIKYGVNDYFVKPLDIKELLGKIETLSRKSKKQKKIDHYQNMINEYLDTINKVAFVFVFDKNKKITYVNEFYTELSKLDVDDVLDNEFNYIYHKDIPSEIINKQWEDLNNNKRWSGNLKFMTKDDTAFYSNCTIIPVLNENGNKFISINFITTKEENNRRNFKKKVLYNFNETKKIYRKAQEKIDSLTKELEHYKGFEKKESEFEKVKNQNNEYINNINNLENKLKDIRNRQELFTKNVNLKMKEISESTDSMKEQMIKADKKVIYLRREIKVREHYIEKIQKELQIKKQKVSDLEDVLNHRESQLYNDKNKTKK